MNEVLDPTTLASLKQSATKASLFLKALANDDRLLILCYLSQGEMNVGELEKATEISQPTLSQQLTILREEGFVKTRRKGKYIYYTLDSNEVVELMKTLAQLFC
ncbi:MAG TPA: metalloregulator ArsR/SmtB family transcription factor [Methylotenera sp.]|nr:metalloregulator ArsR/SmtB family transcription factor [Methylotenera sp.]